MASAAWARFGWGVRAYCLIVAMWLRTTMTYRASFVMMAVGNLVMTVLDFLAIAIMFTHVDELGGFSLAEVALLYGTSGTSFALADLMMGSLSNIGSRVRDGTVDTLLVRPVPVLAQAAADRFALRRVGRLIQGGLLLAWALTQVDVDWTPLNVLLIPVMLLSGTAIFAAVYVLGGAFQFLAQDAAEVQSAFTYGGTTLLQYPPTIFAKELLRGVTFVVPIAFVNWLPVLRLLGEDDPLGLPGWLDYASPLVAVVCCAAAGLIWRAGLRGYQSTGS